MKKIEKLCRITTEQDAFIRTLSEATGASMSEVIRRLLDVGIREIRDSKKKDQLK